MTCPEFRSKSIYYLPGRGSRLNVGLGAALMQRGCTVYGRELNGDFARLNFQDQVQAVMLDIKQLAEAHGARVIANSFGGYLLMHALMQLPPFSGNVLLLSPVMGEAMNDANGVGYIPPRARMLSNAIRSGKFPAPKKCEVHVGELDWQSNPATVSEFGMMINATVCVVPEVGHKLESNYVADVLDRWMTDS